MNKLYLMDPNDEEVLIDLNTETFFGVLNNSTFDIGTTYTSINTKTEFAYLDPRITPPTVVLNIFCIGTPDETRIRMFNFLNNQLKQNMILHVVNDTGVWDVGVTLSKTSLGSYVIGNYLNAQITLNPTSPWYTKEKREFDPTDTSYKRVLDVMLSEYIVPPMGDDLISRELYISKANIKMSYTTPGLIYFPDAFYKFELGRGSQLFKVEDTVDEEVKVLWDNITTKIIPASGLFNLLTAVSGVTSQQATITSLLVAEGKETLSITGNTTTIKTLDDKITTLALSNPTVESPSAISTNEAAVTAKKLAMLNTPPGVKITLVDDLVGTNPFSISDEVAMPESVLKTTTILSNSLAVPARPGLTLAPEYEVTLAGASGDPTHIRIYIEKNLDLTLGSLGGDWYNSTATMYPVDITGEILAKAVWGLNDVWFGLGFNNSVSNIPIFAERRVKLFPEIGLSQNGVSLIPGLTFGTEHLDSTFWVEVLIDITNPNTYQLKKGLTVPGLSLEYVDTSTQNYYVAGNVWSGIRPIMDTSMRASLNLYSDNVIIEEGYNLDNIIMGVWHTSQAQQLNMFWDNYGLASAEGIRINNTYAGIYYPTTPSFSVQTPTDQSTFEFTEEGIKLYNSMNRVEVRSTIKLGLTPVRFEIEQTVLAGLSVGTYLEIIVGTSYNKTTHMVEDIVAGEKILGDIFGAVDLVKYVFDTRFSDFEYTKDGTDITGLLDFNHINLPKLPPGILYIQVISDSDATFTVTAYIYHSHQFI